MTNATPRALPENCACRGCGAAAYDRACPRLRLRRMAEAGAMLAIQAKWALRMMRKAELPTRLCADFEADINAFETAEKENPK